MLRCGVGGTSSPEFSVSPESASRRLTRFVSRFTLFELPAYVYSEGCSRTFQQAIDSGTTAKRTFVVVPIHSEVNRPGHPDRRPAIHRQHPCRWLSPLSRPTSAHGSPVPVQREMERERFPLVSIPPFGR